MDPLFNVFYFKPDPRQRCHLFSPGVLTPGQYFQTPFCFKAISTTPAIRRLRPPAASGSAPGPFCCRRRVCRPDFLFSARSRARMGTDVGVETPVYRRGSDPGMVFSARTRARMGSDVRVQTPVPPPRCPVYGPPCVALHVSIRYARHTHLVLRLDVRCLET